MSNDLQGALAQPVVLLIVQGLGRRNDNGLTGVDAHGIKVLHVTNRNAIVVLVTHHFVLKLLPTLPRRSRQELSSSAIVEGSNFLSEQRFGQHDNSYFYTWKGFFAVPIHPSPTKPL